MATVITGGMAIMVDTAIMAATAIMVATVTMADTPATGIPVTSATAAMVIMGMEATPTGIPATATAVMVIMGMGVTAPLPTAIDHGVGIPITDAPATAKMTVIP